MLKDYGTLDILKSAFHPQSIAIAGASEALTSFGYYYVHHLLDYGYRGRIYPINPGRESVLGLKAYPNLRSVPESIDFVICCLAASKVPDLLFECHEKQVKVVHLFTARLGETGRPEACELEGSILRQAKLLNIRLIGPNCMGIYNPSEGIAYDYGFPKETGTVGALFQSGGASSLLVRYGSLRGLRFSKVVSYGNALDLDESDFLNYLATDNETTIIAAYLEGIKDGPKFLDALAAASCKKPVIIIKGGRDTSGIKAASSHTAAIAGSDQAWDAAFKQTGVIQALDMNALINLLVAFTFLPPIMGNRVAVACGGGGVSVMATDACEKSGLRVPRLPLEIKQELKGRAPEMWDLVQNPIDASIMAFGALSFEDVLNLIAKSPHFDFIMAGMSEENPFCEEIWNSIVSKETDGIVNVFQKQLMPVIAIASGGGTGSGHISGWRTAVLAKQKARLIDANIPTFNSVTEAVESIRKFIDYCKSGNRANV